MRPWMRFVLGVIGAGCGAVWLGACGGDGGACPAGFVRQEAQCALDPAGQWTLTVTSGQVAERDANGESWDAAGGLPDPFVCLTIGSQRLCTSTVDDTQSPVWNETLHTATATALLAGIGAEYFDEDATVDDPICGSNTVPVTISNFEQERWGAGCAQGQFTVTLRVR